jgi:hypothetical protein
MITIDNIYRENTVNLIKNLIVKSANAQALFNILCDKYSIDNILYDNNNKVFNNHSYFKTKNGEQLSTWEIIEKLHFSRRFDYTDVFCTITEAYGVTTYNFIEAQDYMRTILNYIVPYFVKDLKQNHDFGIKLFHGIYKEPEFEEALNIFKTTE